MAVYFLELFEIANLNIVVSKSIIYVWFVFYLTNEFLMTKLPSWFCYKRLFDQCKYYVYLEYFQCQISPTNNWFQLKQAHSIIFKRIKSPLFPLSKNKIQNSRRRQRPTRVINRYIITVIQWLKGREGMLSRYSTPVSLRSIP